MMQDNPFDYLPERERSLVTGYLGMIEEISKEYASKGEPRTPEEADRRTQACRQAIAPLQAAVIEIVKLYPRPLVITAEQAAGIR
jgi:hypothetical protein